MVDLDRILTAQATRFINSLANSLGDYFTAIVTAPINANTRRIRADAQLENQPENLDHQHEPRQRQRQQELEKYSLIASNGYIPEVSGPPLLRPQSQQSRSWLSPIDPSQNRQVPPEPVNVFGNWNPLDNANPVAHSPQDIPTSSTTSSAVSPPTGVDTNQSSLLQELLNNPKLAPLLDAKIGNTEYTVKNYLKEKVSRNEKVGWWARVETEEVNSLLQAALENIEKVDPNIEKVDLEKFTNALHEGGIAGAQKYVESLSTEAPTIATTPSPPTTPLASPPAIASNRKHGEDENGDVVVYQNPPTPTSQGLPPMPA